MLIDEAELEVKVAINNDVIYLPGSKNKFYIAVACDYEVFDDEWLELVNLIEKAVHEYDGGKFMNVTIFLMKQEQEIEQLSEPLKEGSCSKGGHNEHAPTVSRPDSTPAGQGA